jgi:hypothetical protein
LPNGIFYPSVLLGLFWVFSPPLLSLVGCVHLWRHRRETPALFASWVVVLTLTLHTFYRFQGARFMAPPATLLTVVTGIALAQWFTHRNNVHTTRTEISATRSVANVNR